MKEHLFSVTKNDFEIQHFKGSGPGGQSRNKNSTAVRIKHKESGAIGESQEMKSQYQNKLKAFDRLVNSNLFQI
jgi:protein subunit release factor B